MDDEQNKRIPVTGPTMTGTEEQRRAIKRWEDVGSTFLHWTEVPEVIAVMKGPLGEIIFIYENGRTWRGSPVPRKEPVLKIHHSAPKKGRAE